MNIFSICCLALLFILFYLASLTRLSANSVKRYLILCTQHFLDFFYEDNRILEFHWFLFNINWLWIYEFFSLNETYQSYKKGSKTKIAWKSKEIKNSNGKYICMAQMLIHHWIERMWFSCQMTCHKCKMVAVLTLYILNKHNCISPISVWTLNMYNYFFTCDHCVLCRATLRRLT